MCLVYDQCPQSKVAMPVLGAHLACLRREMLSRVLSHCRHVGHFRQPAERGAGGGGGDSGLRLGHQPVRPERGLLRHQGGKRARPHSPAQGLEESLIRSHR
jgi:hypothetical protein